MVLSDLDSLTGLILQVESALLQACYDEVDFETFGDVIHLCLCK